MSDIPVTPFLRKLQEMDPAFAEPVLKLRELATYAPGALDVNVLPARIFHTDDVAGLYLKRGDIYFAVVDLDVTVIHQLSRLTA